jgi:hypothetical protein
MAYSRENSKATAIRNVEFLDLMSYYKFSRERPCTVKLSSYKIRYLYSQISSFDINISYACFKVILS